MTTNISGNIKSIEEKAQITKNDIKLYTEKGLQNIPQDTMDINPYNETNEVIMAKSKIYKKMKIIIITAISLVAILALVLGLYFGLRNPPPSEPKNPGQPDQPPKTDIPSSSSPNPSTKETTTPGDVDGGDIEGLKEIFKSEFKIQSKVNDLSQIQMSTSSKSSNGNSEQKTFIKATYDIYTLAQNAPNSEFDSNFYAKKYVTSIAINSYCSTINAEDCTPITYLDLNYNDETLRSLDEEEVNIEEVDFPFCLIEHTDSNIITSISCPKMLDESLKNIIMTAFKNIKPVTIKGSEDDNTYSDTKIENTDEKIIVNTFSNYCEDDSMDINDKNCVTKINIITDKEGNLISSLNNQTILQGASSKEYNYMFENLNSANLDVSNYKNHLDKLINLLEPYMIKDVKLGNNSFQELLEEEWKESEEKERRNLDEEIKVSNNPGILETTVFSAEYNDIKVTFNLSDDILNDDMPKTVSKITLGNITDELSHNEVFSNLMNIFTNFKILSDALNSLGSKLYDKLIVPLMELSEFISSELSDLYQKLAFKELSGVFDSTFAIGELKEFTYEIVPAANNIYNRIKNLSDNLIYDMDEYKQALKSDINTYISGLDNKFTEIFDNLRDFYTAISSPKSKLASIASYYGMNNTKLSFVTTVERAKEILNTYFIKQKEKIEPLIDDMLTNFMIVSREEIINQFYLFNNVTNRLEDEEVTIKRGDDNDIRNVINNFYNTKILENSILENIQVNMKKNLLLSNGYFTSDTKIESYNSTNFPIVERLFNISKTMEDGGYTDKTFDEIMKYFRDQLIIIIDERAKNISENFPSKENILDYTSFHDNLVDLNDYLKNEKISIINTIKIANNNFMNSISNTITDFLTVNQTFLQNAIDFISDQLSKINLNNIDNEYNTMLNYTFDNITNIIDSNNELLLGYMHDIKSTTFRTKCAENKINKFRSQMTDIKTYIQINFKNDVMNKYRYIINKIRENLQSIKSNPTIKNYSDINQLSILKSHIENYIEPLFLRLEEYISEKIFNEKYLNRIKDFINKTITKLDDQKSTFDKLYKPIGKLSAKSDTTNDFYYKETYKSCKKILGIFKSCSKKTRDKGKKVSSSDNYKKLTDIRFEEYSKDFDDSFSIIYSNILDKTTIYNSLISFLGHNLEELKTSFSEKNFDMFGNITTKVKSFLNQELGNNILQLSYNHFKNEINQKLPIELNAFLEQWKSLFNEVYEEIKVKINQFKYPIEEFSNLATIYYSFYSQNISYLFSDLLMNQRKYDFNHTIKYNYNSFLSKINKTYTYILNNIPKNEKPFDDIFDSLISDINESYNEINNLTIESREQILNEKNQLSFLKVSVTNFFGANSYANDLSETIDNELKPLIEKIDEIIEKSPNKFDSEESVATRFYLENYENGKQINDIYDTINKGTFLDLQNQVYQELFQSIMEIDEIDIKNKIIDQLRTSNDKLKKIFDDKVNTYKNDMQNEIFKQLYTKEEIEEKIDEIYSQGIKELKEESKLVILDNIEEIMVNIESQIEKEKLRLQDQMTYYSSKFTLIENRIDEYSTNIFNQINSIINSVVTEFDTKIYSKFYTNYIEVHINEFYNKIKSESFPEKQFLNMSFNLKDEIDQKIEIFTDEYKNWAKSHINFLKQKHIQKLDELFVFKDLKTNIKDRLILKYNSTLYPILVEKAIYNSGDDGITDYDFPQNILDEINNFINNKTNKIENEILEMKGTKYEIDEADWKIPDYSEMKRNLINPILNDFNNKFYNVFHSSEIENFYDIMSDNLINNFKHIINDFIPSFGQDYFDRVLKYNEIQKVKMLYSKLKNSVGVSLTYYIFLTLSNSIDLMPEELKINILSLNNLDNTISMKNQEIISSLNSKFDNFVQSTKDELINEYISYIKNSLTLKNSFNDDIMNIVKEILDNKKTTFENQYTNMMNNYIKNPFIQKYTSILEREKEDMIIFINSNKEQLRYDLNSIESVNSNEDLHNLETKKENTLTAINEYDSLFESFHISNKVQNFLNNYIDKNIIPVHNELKGILDSQVKNLIIENLNITSEDFTNSYNYELMENKINEINTLLKILYFNNMTQSLKDYGIIDTIYAKNLENEIINKNNMRLRRLENNEQIIEQQLNDIKLNKVFNSLKTSSESLISEIQNTNIFSDFKSKLNNYINKITEQYDISKNLIKERRYTEDINQKLYQKLEELKDTSLSYYINIRDNYGYLEEYIKNSISKIDRQIKTAYEITHDTLITKYEQFKNDFTQINQKIENEKNINYENIYNEIIGDQYSNVHIQIDKFLFNNEFKFDYEYNDENPNIIGKSLNKNRPDKFNLDFSFKVGKCVYLGKDITVNLNDISSEIDINFNSSSLEARITKKYNFNEYNINYKFYEEQEKKKTVKIGGVITNKITCVRHEISTPEGEKESETIEAKSANSTEILLI